MGVRESDTGLASANLWDTNADVQRQQQHPFQVARCQTIIKGGECSLASQKSQRRDAGDEADAVVQPSRHLISLSIPKMELELGTRRVINTLYQSSKWPNLLLDCMIGCRPRISRRV